MTENFDMKISPTAWMIKNDGTEIPVITHVYANENEIDELLALAHFLWTNDTDSQKTVREFLDIWVLRTFPRQLNSGEYGKNELFDAIKNYLLSKPYRIFPDDFVKTASEHAETYVIYDKDDSMIDSGAWPVSENKPGIKEIDMLNKTIDGDWIGGRDMIDTLNQRFMRARYGGKYNTVPGCRDMYFRISSVGFDWFPIIRGFVKKRASRIGTVTVIRDHESTGCERYYTDSENRSYNKMPVADFLSGAARISLALQCRYMPVKTLAEGGGVQQLRCVHMNYGRVRYRIQILKYKEELQLVDE